MASLQKQVVYQNYIKIKMSPTACYKHYYTDSLLTSQDKGAHTRDKSREERVKGKGSHQEAIHKLDNPSQQHVGEVGIHQLELHWSTKLVLVEELSNDGENALRTHLPNFFLVLLISIFHHVAIFV